ncbi:hypothetical protein [Acinetobacter sp.]|uniref:hypothetical protein n=1 Tax=Acinetobacter sp. TaxID=472 RepID=UPI003C781E1D
MRTSKYILSWQGKPFIPHARHPESVLSTALNAAQGMGNVWHPCHIHDCNAY